MQDVTKDRHKYIGGSDIPIIMGISSFKTRFDLLLEKAEIKDNDFDGNEYTEYGNIMEEKIRAHVNSINDREFKEDKKIIDDLRYHADGYDGCTVLEIKTTSQMHNDVNDYKVYLAQLVFGMYMYNAGTGVLAVYDRPADFDEDFDPARLQIHVINMINYRELLNDILQAVDHFRADLEKVKANPFITEEDLQPKDLVVMADKVLALETQLAAYKDIEAQYAALKADLFEAMTKHDVKKWTTNNGVQITRVDGSAETVTMVEVFDEKKFKADNAELYKQYVKEEPKVKKGRAGYIRITLPKEA